MKYLVLAVVCAAAGVAAFGCAGDRASAGGLSSRGVVFDELPTGEKFAVYVPRGEAPKGGWPCIVFLNGSGECGTDGQRQLTQGLLPAVLNRPQEWPFVIVFPQKPASKGKWAAHTEMVMACLGRAEERWPVDADRVYLTGLSQGGNGTWEIGAAKAGVFAAVAPVCGFADPAGTAVRWPGDSATLSEALAATPVWAFHGEKDDVVKPEQTRRMVAALERVLVGQDAPDHMRPVDLQKDDGKTTTLRMTVYGDLNHGCWDRAYRDSGMAAWFLRFGRGQHPQAPSGR